MKTYPHVLPRKCLLPPPGSKERLRPPKGWQSRVASFPEVQFVQWYRSLAVVAGIGCALQVGQPSRKAVIAHFLETLMSRKAVRHVETLVHSSNHHTGRSGLAPESIGRAQAAVEVVADGLNNGLIHPRSRFEVLAPVRPTYE